MIYSPIIQIKVILSHFEMILLRNKFTLCAPLKIGTNVNIEVFDYFLGLQNNVDCHFY